MQIADCRLQIADYRGGGEGNLDFEKLLEASDLCSSQGDKNNRMRMQKGPDQRFQMNPECRMQNAVA